MVYRSHGKTKENVGPGWSGGKVRLKRRNIKEAGRGFEKIGAFTMGLQLTIETWQV